MAPGRLVMVIAKRGLGAAMLAIGCAVAAPAAAHASPDVVGKTLGEATSVLRSAGYSPLVTNTFGGRTDRAACIVGRQQDRLTSNSAQTLLTINCNAPLAGPGLPGNSAASPAGRAAAAAAVTRVAKERIEQSLLSQFERGSGQSWAQCSGDLVGAVGNGVDCKVLANQKKQVYTLTVTGVDDGQISYDIALKE